MYIYAYLDLHYIHASREPHSLHPRPPLGGIETKNRKWKYDHATNHLSAWLFCTSVPVTSVQSTTIHFTVQSTSSKATSSLADWWTSIMASRKCFDTLASASSLNKAAKLHGILTELSPMKSGKYFEGRIADDQTSMRFVGFDQQQQQEFAAYREKNEPVAVDNCQIQKSRYSDDMELMINRWTKVTSSPCKFDEVAKSKIEMKQITLQQLQTLQDFQHVIITVKVLKVDMKMEVKPDLFKQDTTVADSMGTARLTLWQNDISTMKVDKSYLLQNVVVRPFDNAKYLTPPKCGCIISPCDDICQVQEPETCWKM